MMNKNHIFIDTNVLIGAAANREDDVACLRRLSSCNGKKLYISSLSVAQFVSVFQKKKDNKEIIESVKSMLHKYNVISFVQKDIESALKVGNNDLEDNIQYVLSKKLGCLFFITNNVKDFRNYININVIEPSKVRFIN